MKFAIASDTQGLLPEITGEYDIFVHCGNFCPLISGDHASIHSQITWLHGSFLPWLNKVQAKHKIIVPGYMDIAVSYLETSFEYHVNAIYLKDSATTINGMVIYGTPWVPASMKSKLPPKRVYVSNTDKSYELSLAKIPKNTDILITRLPPAGILDGLSGQSIGEEHLLRRVKSLKELKMHFFGMASDDGGKHQSDNNVLFANGCVTENEYVEIVI